MGYFNSQLDQTKQRKVIVNLLILLRALSIIKPYSYHITDIDCPHFWELYSADVILHAKPTWGHKELVSLKAIAKTL